MTPSNYLIGVIIIKYMHFTPKFHCFSLPLFFSAFALIFFWLSFCVTSTKNICSIILSASSCKGL